jgi:tRNA A37 N6-isopentenylltransferase MiaA
MHLTDGQHMGNISSVLNDVPCPLLHTPYPFPSMQAIGYKEITMYLHREISLDEAIMLIKRGTKRYAKRQLTWFRKEEHIQWVDITGVQESNEVFIRVLNTLKTKL